MQLVEEWSKKLSNMLNEGSGYLKRMQTEATAYFDPSGEEATRFQFYFGPNQYQTLKESSKLSTSGKNLHLDKLIYFGWPIVRWVNRFFVVYLFDWLNSWGINMGIVLLLLTQKRHSKRHNCQRLPISLHWRSKIFSKN